MFPPEYPVLLNGRDAEGRIILVDEQGNGYVELPHPAGVPRPSGIVPGPRAPTPLPALMRDPLFRQYPHRQLWANENGTKILVLYWYGNPPPPSPVIDAPPWVRGIARASRGGEAGAHVSWVRRLSLLFRKGTK